MIMNDAMTYLTAAMTGLTAALVLVTAIYAYLTYRMAKASETSARLMEEQSQALTRPYVSVSLVKRHNNPHIFLRVENTGQTTARNMTLRFGPEIESVQTLQGIKEIKDSYLFTKTLASFPPQSPVFFIFGHGASLFSTDKDIAHKTLSATATYSFISQTISETTWLDVNQYNASALDTDPIVSALGHIKEEIAKKK